MFVCCLMNDHISYLPKRVFIFIETVYLLFAMLAISDTARRFLTGLLMIQKGASSHRNVRACYSSRNYLSENSLLPAGRPGCSWYAFAIGALDPSTTSAIEYLRVIQVLK
jgi:hypothetical protein